MVALSSASLGNYNPQLYANEALIFLKKHLGIAKLVNRRFEGERNSYGRGDVVKLRRPAAVTVKTHSDMTFETLSPENQTLTLDTYKHASFEVPDLDILATGRQFVDEHIAPNVVALADAVDAAILGKYTEVGAASAVTATPAASDITAARKVLFDNKCPVTDEANMFFVVSSALDKGLLDLSAFTQWQGSAQPGVEAQIRGMLGTRYGFNFFASQNVPSHTAGAITASAPKVNGALARGATSVIIDDTSLTGTVKAGDIVTISGIAYAITADAPASGNAITVSVSPAIQATVADNTAVTFTQTSKVENLAFHRDAFALAMAPMPILPWMGSALVARQTDEDTGISIRFALGWDITDNKTKCRLDCLFGVKSLNPFLACRARA